MKLIVGLGNPGKQYDKTRHNAGFIVLDKLADQPWQLEKKLHSYYLKTALNNQQVILAKPDTYMNNSGQAVAALLSYYKIDLADLLVVYDDFDLPLGTIRVRPSGSSGGHNGMQSLINVLKTEAIARVRIGIGNMDDPDFAEKRIPREDYVLLPFKPEEKEIFEKTVTSALKIIKEIVTEGINSSVINHQS